MLFRSCREFSEDALINLGCGDRGNGGLFLAEPATDRPCFFRRYLVITVAVGGLGIAIRRCWGFVKLSSARVEFSR